MILDVMLIVLIIFSKKDLIKTLFQKWGRY